jgi:di/tripeptidase
MEIYNDAPPICMDNNHEIFKFTEKIHKEIRIKSFYKDGNTDGDIALLHHIPTVTIGCSCGENTHSSQEFLKISSLEDGFAQLILMITKLSELEFLKT